MTVAFTFEVFPAIVITKIKIDEFLSLTGKYPVIDVRSPSEFSHAHIPGACNLPLFSDEERKVVGTAYKQQSRESAIKTGLDFFGVKMRKMVEETEQLVKSHSSTDNEGNAVLVHCWRGGMRSAGVAWLLDLYGFKVYTLVGGYKAFRQWALLQFARRYDFRVIGGYTGSGKSKVLRELARTGRPILDIESIAHHKGSAFGDLGEQKQDTQEMFENKLAIALNDPEKITWVEDESQRVGEVNIPIALWNHMRKCPVYFLDVPFEERLKYITEEYGKFKKEELVAAVIRIQKRLGGLNTRNTVSYLLEDNVTEAFRILLSYYDKYYKKALEQRENLEELLITVPCADTGAKVNSLHLLSAYNNTIETQ
jgi:tRNA 2-selenouridine synthase